MNLQRVTDLNANGHKLPAFLLTPDGRPKGGVLLLHPYGGGKEHMLGLAAYLGESGWACLAIDNCGHGENTAPIGPEMRNEVEAGLQYLRRFGTTVTIGLSLGGRLSLMSSADLMVAISPAAVAEVSPQGKWMFENFPSPAVREPYPGYAVQLLDELGPVLNRPAPCLIIYAQRDIPNIMNGAADLKAALPHAEVHYITEDLRPDVQHENGFIRYLPRWFNHGELKFNLEVLRTTAKWLAQAHAVARGA